ncbi:MAG: hypothetical protein WBE76_23690 [Terracidiphilus sp.]
MSLIKKIDVKEHFAAKRRMRLVAARQASLADATGFSGVEPDLQRANAADCVEDFLGENSSPGQSVASAAIADESGGRQVPTVPESRQA